MKPFPTAGGAFFVKRRKGEGGAVLNRDEIRGLLERCRNGDATIEETTEALARMPYENLGFAHIDHHRELRQGFPEVIYAEGKTKEQTRAIFQRLLSESAKSVMAAYNEINGVPAVMNPNG